MDAFIHVSFPGYKDNVVLVGCVSRWNNQFDRQTWMTVSGVTDSQFQQYYGEDAENADAVSKLLDTIFLVWEGHILYGLSFVSVA